MPSGLLTLVGPWVAEVPAVLCALGPAAGLSLSGRPSTLPASQEVFAVAVAAAVAGVAAAVVAGAVKLLSLKSSLHAFICARAEWNRASRA